WLGFLRPGWQGALARAARAIRRRAGMADSPVYVEGRVILLIDTPDQAYLAAGAVELTGYEATTGERLWWAWWRHHGSRRPASDRGQRHLYARAHRKRSASIQPDAQGFRQEQGRQDRAFGNYRRRRQRQDHVPHLQVR